ncbi:MAG: BadF/BadG/BcrA/BcrD ATPase family protein [Bacilli bacterium]|nr:BadF/BadG/BcrA/BcrD ATPase family protein [Bacilli bacterium]
MENIIIGVDAGGTKTKVCAFDKKGNILCEIYKGCGSPAVIDKNIALSNIIEAIKEVYNIVKNKYNVLYLQTGISGLGVLSLSENEIYKSLLEKLVNCEVGLDNDAVLAWNSYFKQENDEGIVILSGTGSCVYGVKNNKGILMGGWGQLSNEVGSAYAVVRELLLRTIKKCEEEGTISPLTEKFLKLFGFTDVYEIKVFMYNNSKKEIASYANFIIEEASNNDQEAICILEKAGIDLADLIRLQYKRHNFINAKIALRGSFIQNTKITQESLLKTLKIYGLDAEVSFDNGDPIMGAYNLARKKGKI